MPDPLVVFAPGSILPVQGGIVAGFREVAPDVEVVFHPPAYSGLLARQILNGTAADAFISANREYMDDLHAAGLVSAPRLLAGNRLCVVVRNGLAPSISTIADLARDGVRVVVPPSATDPLGQYVAELFARAGMTDVMARKRAKGDIIEDLHGLARGLVEDTVDAAIVYATSAASLAPAGVAVELAAPYDLRDRIAFTIGTVGREGIAHPSAERFVAFLLGSRGEAILREAGFLPLPDAAPTWPRDSWRRT